MASLTQVNYTFSGQLTKLRVEHDNSGFLPSWCLDKIEVVNTMTTETTTFPCRKWLDKKKDHDIAIDLYPRD